VAPRPVYDGPRVDVDPLDDRQPLVLVIRSENGELARKVAIFLQSEAGGELSDEPPQRHGGGS
jgi:hypothetical protein